MNIVITGASRGIGKAVAEKFAAASHQVIVCSRDEQKLSELKKQHASIITFSCDVSQKEEIQRFGDFVLQTFDKIDVLVNNAGILIAGDIEESSYEDWKRLMNVNADSVFLGCKAAIAVMKKQGGSIVNMSSIAALAGKEDYVAYCASKGAVAALTRAVAADCRLKRYRIRCNSVHPDGILTAMTRATYPKGVDPDMLTIDKDPMNRACLPLDVAQGVLYLASDEARAVNGIELRIDSGQFVMSI